MAPKDLSEEKNGTPKKEDKVILKR